MLFSNPITRIGIVESLEPIYGVWEWCLYPQRYDTGHCRLNGNHQILEECKVMRLLARGVSVISSYTTTCEDTTTDSHLDKASGVE